MSMQNTSTPAPASTGANWVSTYGLFVLSLVALLIIAAAWLTRVVDQQTALDVIVAILVGNGLVSAQAAPGFIGQAAGIIGQLTNHIETLHAQQLASQQTPSATTMKLPATPAPTPQAAVQMAVPQQPFSAAPSASLLGIQSAPLSQSWPTPPPSQRSAGG